MEPLGPEQRSYPVAEQHIEYPLSSPPPRRKTGSDRHLTYLQYLPEDGIPLPGLKLAGQFQPGAIFITAGE